jgi:beta-1,2-mannobiose phosphorylase / 1,2-beta-oligomannan phosphorylase
LQNPSAFPTKSIWLAANEKHFAGVKSPKFIQHVALFTSMKLATTGGTLGPESHTVKQYGHFVPETASAHNIQGKAARGDGALRQIVPIRSVSVRVYHPAISIVRCADRHVGRNAQEETVRTADPTEGTLASASRPAFLWRPGCVSADDADNSLQTLYRFLKRSRQNRGDHVLSNNARSRFIQWGTIIAVVAVLLIFCRDAAAEDDAGLFPPEIVTFHPIEDNPIFQGRGKGHWDEHIRERGWILRNEDNWQMWFTGFEGGGGNNGPNLKLGYATSSDGLHWKRYSGNPVYDEKWVEDMMIVKRDGTYHMFAEGKYDIAQLLTSPDGIHWTRIGPLDIRLVNGQPISEGPRGTPAAWFEDDTWYLFYERRDLGIWLATSADMKVWTNVSDDPVIALGPESYDDRQVAVNQILKHNNVYYAYYHGSGRSAPKLWCTCVAASKDLVHWTKYDGNPLLPIEDNKSSGILVHDGKQFRLYTMHNKVHVHYPGNKPTR